MDFQRPANLTRERLASGRAGSFEGIEKGLDLAVLGRVEISILCTAARRLAVAGIFVDSLCLLTISAPPYEHAEICSMHATLRKGWSRIVTVSRSSVRPTTAVRMDRGGKLQFFVTGEPRSASAFVRIFSAAGNSRPVFARNTPRVIISGVQPRSVFASSFAP